MAAKVGPEETTPRDAVSNDAADAFSGIGAGFGTRLGANPSATASTELSAAICATKGCGEVGFTRGAGAQGCGGFFAGGDGAAFCPLRGGSLRAGQGSRFSGGAGNSEAQHILGCCVWRELRQSSAALRLAARQGCLDASAEKAHEFFTLAYRCSSFNYLWCEHWPKAARSPPNSARATTAVAGSNRSPALADEARTTVNCLPSAAAGRVLGGAFGCPGCPVGRVGVSGNTGCADAAETTTAVGGSAFTARSAGEVVDPGVADGGANGTLCGFAAQMLRERRGVLKVAKTLFGAFTLLACGSRPGECVAVTLSPRRAVVRILSDPDGTCGSPTIELLPDLDCALHELAAENSSMPPRIVLERIQLDNATLHVLRGANGLAAAHNLSCACMKLVYAIASVDEMIEHAVHYGGPKCRQWVARTRAGVRVRSGGARGPGGRFLPEVLATTRRLQLRGETTAADLLTAALDNPRFAWETLADFFDTTYRKFVLGLQRAQTPRCMGYRRAEVGLFYAGVELAKSSEALALLMQLEAALCAQPEEGGPHEARLRALLLTLDAHASGPGPEALWAAAKPALAAEQRRVLQRAVGHGAWELLPTLKSIFVYATAGDGVKRTGKESRRAQPPGLLNMALNFALQAMLDPGHTELHGFVPVTDEELRTSARRPWYCFWRCFPAQYVEDFLEARRGALETRVTVVPFACGSICTDELERAALQEGAGKEECLDAEKRCSKGVLFLDPAARAVFWLDPTAHSMSQRFVNAYAPLSAESAETRYHGWYVSDVALGDLEAAAHAQDTTARALVVGAVMSYHVAYTFARLLGWQLVGGCAFTLDPPVAPGAWALPRSSSSRALAEPLQHRLSAPGPSAQRPGAVGAARPQARCAGPPATDDNERLFLRVVLALRAKPFCQDTRSLAAFSTFAGPREYRAAQAALYSQICISDASRSRALAKAARQLKRVLRNNPLLRHNLLRCPPPSRRALRCLFAAGNAPPIRQAAPLMRAVRRLGRIYRLFGHRRK